MSSRRRLRVAPPATRCSGAWPPEGSPPISGSLSPTCSPHGPRQPAGTVDGLDLAGRGGAGLRPRRAGPASRAVHRRSRPGNPLPPRGPARPRRTRSAVPSALRAAGDG
jgi:hypothetical protein